MTLSNKFTTCFPAHELWACAVEIIHQISTWYVVKARVASAVINVDFAKVSFKPDRASASKCATGIIRDALSIVLARLAAARIEHGNGTVFTCEAKRATTDVSCCPTWCARAAVLTGMQVTQTDKIVTESLKKL